MRFLLNRRSLRSLYRAIYDPNGPAAILAFIAYGIVAVALWWRGYQQAQYDRVGQLTDFLTYASGYYRVPKPRAKYMRPTCIGATFMSLGYLIRFTRRNGISAWSWLFETLVCPTIIESRNTTTAARLTLPLTASSSSCRPSSFWLKTMSYCPAWPASSRPKSASRSHLAPWSSSS